MADPALDADDPALDLDLDLDLDRMIFGRILDLAANDPLRSLPQALALPKGELAALTARHAPGHVTAVAALADACADTGEEAIEEADLRAYIAEHGARGSAEERWLAAVLARRSLEPNHLWQDMGFRDRRELNAMFRRHFPALVARNANDMKWKKFFYRELCEREGMTLCKSPNCDVCEDVTVCFEEESGDPLNALARLANGQAATGKAA